MVVNVSVRERSSRYFVPVTRRLRMTGHGVKGVAERNHASSGDQAGSDASPGVDTARSLNPVMSMDTRREE